MPCAPASPPAPCWRPSPELGHSALAIRVGLSSGDVVIRPTGQDATDYDAMGVTAHIAARLEQLAEPGTVLLAAATAQLVQGLATLEPLGPVALRGLDAPLPTYRLLEAADRSSWEVRSTVNALSRFIGREAELAQLGLALRRARLRRGQAVSLVAEAGVGKSRLVHEVLRTLRPEEWRVLRAGATPQLTGVPYAIAAALLRELAGAAPSDPVAEVAARLSAVLARQGGMRDAAPLLSLLDQEVEDAEWAALDRPARRRRLVAALAALVLREAAAGPVVLVVEDYHWVDQPSMAVLEAIVEAMGAARLLVLVTTRPERRPAWHDGRLGADGVEIGLQTLAPGSADALLAELLGNWTRWRRCGRASSPRPTARRCSWRRSPAA